MKEYDIGLSFAGEDRQQVEGVLLELARRNVRCFYDREEIPQLWGTDLAETLARIYTKQCRYFMPFISKAYVARVWPNHEFRSALQRAIRSDETFILPLRLDDSEFDLLNENISYLDLRNVSPAEIADAVIAKLGYNVGAGAVGTAVVPSAAGIWHLDEDSRVQRHRSYIASQYPWWAEGPRLTLLSATPGSRSIPEERLRNTFLSLGVRYSEALNFATEVRTHALGYTREFPSRNRARNEEPSDSWTCYRDGLVASEWRAQDFEDKFLLNLNGEAYNILRALQLSNEVLDPTSAEMMFVSTWYSQIASSCRLLPCLP